MAWFEHSDAHIYYEDEGGGPPVLLLPGWGGSIAELGQVRAALKPGFRVIAADLPGSGRSGPQPRTYTATYYSDDAEALAALLQHLNAAPAHLVGFSDGGECALLIAARRPQIATSVAAWGAVGQIYEAMPGIFDAFAALADDPIEPLRAFSTYMKATYGEGNARKMLQSAAAAWKEISAVGGDISRSRAANIACPALLVTGEQDFLATPALVAELAATIPHGRFELVKGADHAVHETHGDWLAATIAGWLAEVQSPAPAGPS